MVFSVLNKGAVAAIAPPSEMRTPSSQPASSASPAAETAAQSSPCEPCGARMSCWSSRRRSAAHSSEAAFRGGSRGFVLNDVPMLSEDAVLQAHDVHHHPIRRFCAETGVSRTKVSVSLASVNGVHSAASANKTGSRAVGKTGSDSACLTSFASPCTSSSGPCQGEGRRFEPGVPLQIIPDLRWLHAGVRVSCFRSARRRSPVL